eukprot:2805695-Lingulodinium_polyedra.AAC.1
MSSRRVNADPQRASIEFTVTMSPRARKARRAMRASKARSRSDSASSVGIIAVAACEFKGARWAFQATQRVA